MTTILTAGRMVMDYNVDLDQYPTKGSASLAAVFRPEPGGKGLNLAVAFANLGVESFMMAKLGEDRYGAEILETIDRYNVNRDYVEIDPSMSTGIILSIIEFNSGVPTFILTNPDSGRLKPSFIEERQGLLGRVHAVIVNPSISLPATLRLLELTKEVNEKALTILNYAPPVKLEKAETAKLINTVDYLIGTQSDLQGLVKKDNPIEIASTLNSQGFKNVIVTDGVDGGVFVSGNSSFQFESYPISDRQDLTGSSDAFIAGFITSILEDKTIENSLKYGIAAGGLTTRNIGGVSSMPHRRDLEYFIVRPQNRDTIVVKPLTTN